MRRSRCFTIVKIISTRIAPIKLRTHKPHPAQAPNAAETQISDADVSPLTLAR
jgi:hypothetical protein